jgi:hypothetical protein
MYTFIVNNCNSTDDSNGALRKKKTTQKKKQPKTHKETKRQTRGNNFTDLTELS